MFFKKEAESQKKVDLLCLLILVFLILVFFYNPLLNRRVFYYDDIEMQHYPIKVLFRHMGEAGKIFWWNPYLFSGMPLVADTNTALFYPVNWLYFFIDTGRGIVYYVVIHFFIAGLFTYLFLKRKKIDPPASLAGAVFYTFSSFMVLRIIHLNIMTACALIPMVFYFLDGFTDKKSLKSAVVFGFFLGVEILSGMPQMSQLIFMMAGIFFLAHLNYKELLKSSQLKFIGLFVFALVFSLAVASVQLFPTYELIRNCVRSSGIPFGSAAANSLSAPQMLMTIIPDYFGTHLDKGGFAIDAFYWETCFYVGVFPLILSILALFTCRKEDKRTITAFSVIFLLGFLLALGRHFPLYYIFYKVVPFFKSVRIPTRYLCATVLAMAYFIALTINNLPDAWEYLKEKGEKRVAFVIALISLLFSVLLIFIYFFPPKLSRGVIYFVFTGITGIVILAGTLFGNIDKKWFQILSIFILILSAFSFGLTMKPSKTPDYFRKRSDQIKKYENLMPPARIHYFPQNQLKTTLNLTDDRKISNMVGNSPLILERYARYMLMAQFGIDLTEQAREGLVKNSNMFEITDPESKMIRLLAPTAFYHIDYRPNGTFVSIEPIVNAYPRAFTTDRFIVEKDPFKILVTLKEGKIEPDKILFLEEQPVLKAVNFAPAAPGMAGDDTVKFLSFEPDNIKLSVNPSKPCILFLSEIYYPGWKAYVDGKERKVYRAHSIFRAVPLAPGDKTVEIIYVPNGARQGATITIAAVLFLISLLVTDLVLNKTKKIKN